MKQNEKSNAKNMMIHQYLLKAVQLLLVFPVIGLLIQGCDEKKSVAATTAVSENASDIPPERAEMSKWFQDAKFGMFIHWGIYSTVGQGEWVLHNSPKFNDGTQAGLDAYKSRAALFAMPANAKSPEEARKMVEENIHNIVKAAKSAGMQYILLVTRHHDGYSLWDTKATPYVEAYNSTKTSGSKIDVVKVFAEETKKQGMKLSLYYSLKDWTNPLYPDIYNDINPEDKTPYSLKLYSDRKGDNLAYQKFMRDQFTELLTHYDTTIASIWFDGFWAMKDPKNWDIEKLYAHIHKVSPATLIGDNKGLGFSSYIPGEDYQISELGLADLNHANSGSEVDLTIQTNPKESTADDWWGYNAESGIHDTKWIIARLVDCVSAGQNLVLNFGPNASGELRPGEVSELKEVGEWVKANQEAIYGTRTGKSYYAKASVKASANAGEKNLYLFAMSPEKITVKLGGATIKDASVLADKGKITFTSANDEAVFDLSGVKATENSPAVIKVVLSTK